MPQPLIIVACILLIFQSNLVIGQTETPTTPFSQYTTTSQSVEVPTTLQYTNNQLKLDSAKEVIDYENELLDTLRFIQTEKLAGNEGAKAVESILNKYHNNEEVHQYLFDLAQKYPDITRLYSIGESVEGKKLWALEITENPGKHELLKPEFNYVANIHGNEIVGREILLHLARLLVENYKQAQEEPLANTAPTGPKFVKKLLKSTRIHILPSLNPDGYAKSEPGCRHEKNSLKGRLNANNIDLNRNFPNKMVRNKIDSATQPEVKAIIEWACKEPFVLSANLHGGALVSAYPYDGLTSRDSNTTFSPTPDDDVFKHLARVYSNNHATMSSGKTCYDMCDDDQKDEVFENGVVNGAEWYPFYGGMPDWLYENTNSLDINVELGCNMYPPANTLSQYWQYNKRALLNYMKEAHRGIKGTVKDSKTGALLPDVRVHVVNRQHNITTTRFGDYFRILLPGHYDIIFEKAGYVSEEIHVFVQQSMAQIHNIVLHPIGESRGSSNGDSSSMGSSNQEAEGGDHSIVLATLIMTIIIALLMVAMAGAYVIQKRRFKRVRSMSMELQQRRANLSTAGSGISLPGQTGSSTNPNLPT